MQTKTYAILKENYRKEIVKKINISMRSSLLSIYLDLCSEESATDFLEITGKNQKGKTVKVTGSLDNIEAMIQFKGIEIIEQIAHCNAMNPLPNIPAFYNN